MQMLNYNMLVAASFPLIWFFSNAQLTFSFIYIFQERNLELRVSDRPYLIHSFFYMYWAALNPNTSWIETEKVSALNNLSRCFHG